MLVSKIKPCMSQYQLLHGNTANGSLNSESLFDGIHFTDTFGNSRANTCLKDPTYEGLCLLDSKPSNFGCVLDDS